MQITFFDKKASTLLDRMKISAQSLVKRLELFKVEM